MAGVIFLILLQNILTTLAIEPFGRQIILGAALLVLMFVYGRQHPLRPKVAGRYLPSCFTLTSLKNTVSLSPWFCSPM